MQESEVRSLFRTWKALFRLGIVQQSSPCVNRAIHSIRKVTGSYPNGATRMATVAEQTMARKNAERDQNAHRSTLRCESSAFSCISFAGCNHRDARRER